MPDVYIPGEMSRLYGKLEKSIKYELIQEVNQEFHRQYPGVPDIKLDWDDPKDKPWAREWLRIRDKLLSKKMNGCFLAEPQVVLQGQRPLCWAASYESWLWATSKIRMSQEQLRKKFAKHDPSGALTIRSSVEDIVAKNELKEVFEYFGTGCQLIRANKLTYSYLLELLNTNSHLLAIFNTGSMAHTVVIYAIFIDPDGTSKIKVMDPLAGYLDYNLEKFKTKNVLFAWKLKGIFKFPGKKK